jgi:hypothetical protein
MMQAFHGERELFRSDHTDWALASTIQNKCRVHNLKAYQVRCPQMCRDCILSSVPSSWFAPAVWDSFRAFARMLLCTRQSADMPVLQALKKVDEEDFFARFTYVVSWLCVDNAC